MFTSQKKIYYHDTDCGGVVYYANYLKYFEEARTEFMLNLGIELKELQARGVLFVVRNVEINYKSPARYADRLTIETSLKKARNVTLAFYQCIKRDDLLLVEAATQLVCIDKGFKPQPIPSDIQALLTPSAV
jgi:acyl-CoA thioester hydrolase